MASAASSDGGLGVVRIKPLGAGGGGGERSAGAASAAAPSVQYSTEAAEVVIDGRRFAYPSHVISPEMDQEALYEAFMAARVDAFLEGTNANIMAYGQTGSGKTHTVFGPPGIMAKAAAGEFGDGIVAEYGLYPRALINLYVAARRLLPLLLRRSQPRTRTHAPLP